MKKGFTLIELLIILAIIGVLSTIALTSINSAKEKAQLLTEEQTHECERYEDRELQYLPVKCLSFFGINTITNH